MAIELRLVIHSHNQGQERSRDKHRLALRREMEGFAVVEGQLGIAELMLFRRALNRDFGDVSRMWVFSIG